MPKTVIEVEILDEKFKAFIEAFKDFQKTIDEAKKKIGEVGNVSAEAGEKTKKSFDAAGKALDNFNKVTVSSLSTLKQISSVVFDVAKSAASAALSFAKWMAFGAIGTGFGLGALGASAVGTNTQATGYGVSSGNLRAAKVAYGQMGLDVEGMLSKISQTKLDPTFGAAYSQFGISGQANMSSSDILAQILRGSKNVSTANLGQMKLVSQLGLGYEEINKMHGQSPAEIEAAIAKQKKLAPAYETNEKGWAGFMQALGEAGELIETSLIKNLTKLTPALSGLARSLSETINKGLSSGEFQTFITKIGLGIRDLAKYLGSDEFREHVKSFFYALTDLVEGIQKIVHFILHPIDTTVQASKDAWNWMTANPMQLTGNQREILERNQNAKLSQGMLESQVRISKTEHPELFDTDVKFNAQVQKISNLLEKEMDKYAGQPQQQLKAILAAKFGENTVEQMMKQRGGITSDPRAQGLINQTGAANSFGQFYLTIMNNASSDVNVQGSKINPPPTVNYSGAR